MRALSLFALLLLPLSSLQAAPATPDQLTEVFDLAGIRLLCEQSAPLIQRGLGEAQQQAVATAFDADTLCDDLAREVAGTLDAGELPQIQALLSSPVAARFTAAERAVGEAEGAEGLAGYREQLKSKPPREERLALVRRLDAAAHTSELATLLRYETGKTQALIGLRARGGQLSEAELAKQTAKQLEALRSSSEQAVESFMLYAYRQMPSADLREYADLYEQDPVQHLLGACVELLPKVFAARRATLK